jgi:uroporphyrinogen-III synthase
MHKPLADIGILVTRPKHQAAAFIKLLEHIGARAVAFPSIEILPVNTSEQLIKRAESLEKYSTIIFISVNAAEIGANWLKKTGKSLQNIKIAAIGKSTSKVLQDLNIKVDITPEQGFNSEALLNLTAMQAGKIANKQVLIIRGRGGREFLADTLKSRGAGVDYAEVYQRRQPTADITPILELFSKNLIQLITVTSNDALKNLYHMMNKQGQNELLKTGLIVPSQRCAELAKNLGFTSQVIVATSATNDAMLNAIKNWRA